MRPEKEKEKAMNIPVAFACPNAAAAFCMAALTVVILLNLGTFATGQQPAAPAAAKRFDKWIVIGPGGGGAQFHPAISPHDARKVFAASDMSQGFVSEDGGESWRMFNLHGAIGFFALDPVEANVVYAKTTALYRSADGGRTWELVHPSPSNVVKIAAISDHAWERIITKDGSDESVEALTVDPADSKTLYAAMSAAGRVVFCVSTDWGRAWKKERELPGGGTRIFVDPGTPPGARTIYVAGTNSIAVREGGRWTRHKPPEGVTAFNEVAAGFSDGGGPVMYAVSGRDWRGREDSVAGVFVSRDGGAAWERCDGGIASQFEGLSEHLQYRTVACSPRRPEIAYVSYKVTNPERGKLPLFMGVAKTGDDGATWELVWKDTSQTPGPGMKDAWMNERFGPEWGENPFNIDVAATDPDIAFATDFGRTMRTTDGGKTWVGVYSKLAKGGGWTTTGLDMTTCYGVHWDPFEPNRVWIDYTDIGAFVSEDGGKSWKSGTAEGVPNAWVNTTYWMVFDPKVKGRVWAVMSGVHDLPFAKMWRRGGVAQYNGGVCRSDDGGRTWRRSTEGMRETAATHILVDPDSPVDARVLYVAGLGTGVWKSTDGGKSWSLKNKGLAGKEPFAWRLARDGKGTLYLVVARRSYDGGFGNGGDGAIYRSTDGAGSWREVKLPRGVNGPFGITVDPEDDVRLYVAAWGRYDPNGDVDGGIFLSTDAGATWKRIFSKQQHVYDVTIDPVNPSILYAGTMSSSVWRSTDGGATWRRLKGYNFKQAKRVIIDPRDTGHIFVTTFGGSVWYGPAEGDAEAEEDIATPIVSYDRWEEGWGA